MTRKNEKKLETESGLYKTKKRVKRNTNLKMVA